MPGAELSLTGHMGQYLVPDLPHAQVHHRTNHKRFNTIETEGYHWTRKRLNGPGALNYAFDRQSLFEIPPSGPSFGVQNMFKPMEPPLFMQNLQVVINGLGGLVLGQTLSQPLFDPYNNIFGNTPGPIPGPANPAII